MITFVDDQLVPRLQALRDSNRGELAVRIGTVFAGVENRMRSGYQLREVLNQLDKVHFTSSDDIYTMGFLYESMLREVRDAAGDSGEFYTPRPVIRFMVQQVAPKLGEIVLDPAAGTGGFLGETWEHLRGAATSVRQREKLQASLRGYEKKPQPYLLGMMNMVLHEIDVPQLIQENALSKLQESRSAAHQVNVVLTNPPFGGAESEDVVKAFPPQYRTAETAWLFMTTALDKLKVGGRCGIVLPNGVLFGEGVGARIKERLLRECDLHTVVRLPDGVFAPYTLIPTNLLFFEKKAASKKVGWSTKETWFYEVVPTDGRKRYTKTKPMRDEDFADCAQWWGGEERAGRVESNRAWTVPVEQFHQNGFNLDLRNPNGGDDLGHRPPQELVKELIETEHEILGILQELQQSLDALEYGRRLEVGFVESLLNFSFEHEDEAPAADVMEQCLRPNKVESGRFFRIAGVYSFGRGVFRRGLIDGSETKCSTLFEIREGDLVMSRLKAFEGAVAIADRSVDGCFVSQEFPTFRIDPSVCHLRYIHYLCRWPGLWSRLVRTSKGLGSRRERVSAEMLLATQLPLPSLAKQEQIVSILDQGVGRLDQLMDQRQRLLDALQRALLNAAFSGQL